MFFLLQASDQLWDRGLEPIDVLYNQTLNPYNEETIARKPNFLRHHGKDIYVPLYYRRENYEVPIRWQVIREKSVHCLPSVNGWGRRQDHIIYLPENPKAVVIYFYGGAIEPGYFAPRAQSFYRNLVQRGIAVISLRLSDNYNPPVDGEQKPLHQSQFISTDIESIITQIAGYREYFDKINTSELPESIKGRVERLKELAFVSTGGSFGGKLTLLMATHPTYNTYLDGYMPESAPTYVLENALPQKDVIEGKINFKDERIFKCHTACAKGSNLGRDVLLVHGLEDTRVGIGNALAFYASLSTTKDWVQLYLSQEMAHDYGNIPEHLDVVEKFIIQVAKKCEAWNMCSREYQFEGFTIRQAKNLFYRYPKEFSDFFETSGRIVSYQTLSEFLQHIERCPRGKEKELQWRRNQNIFEDYKILRMGVRDIGDESYSAKSMKSWALQDQFKAFVLKQYLASKGPDVDFDGCLASFIHAPERIVEQIGRREIGAQELIVKKSTDDFFQLFSALDETHKEYIKKLFESISNLSEFYGTLHKYFDSDSRNFGLLGISKGDLEKAGIYQKGKDVYKIVGEHMIKIFLDNYLPYLKSGEDMICSIKSHFSEMNAEEKLLALIEQIDAAKQYALYGDLGSKFNAILQDKKLALEDEEKSLYIPYYWEMTKPLIPIQYEKKNGSRADQLRLLIQLIKDTPSNLCFVNYQNKEEIFEELFNMLVGLRNLFGIFKDEFLSGFIELSAPEANKKLVVEKIKTLLDTPELREQVGDMLTAAKERSANLAISHG